MLRRRSPLRHDLVPAVSEVPDPGFGERSDVRSLRVDVRNRSRSRGRGRLLARYVPAEDAQWSLGPFGLHAAIVAFCCDISGHAALRLGFRALRRPAVSTGFDAE
jgi:hypothetical protein